MVSSLIYVRRVQSIIQFAGVRVIHGIPINDAAYDKFFSNYSLLLIASMHDVRVEANHRRAVNIRGKAVYVLSERSMRIQSTLMWFHCLQWCQFCFQIMPVFLNRDVSAGMAKLDTVRTAWGTINE